MSKYSVCLIALDRMVAIALPLRHRSFMTPRRENIIIVLVWMVLVSYITSINLIWPYASGFRAKERPGNCYLPIHFDVIFNQIHRFFAGYLPFIIIFTSYSVILIVIIKSYLIRSKMTELRGKNEWIKIIKSFRTTSVMILAFFITYLGMQVVEILNSFKMKYQIFLPYFDIRYFFNYIGYISGVVNPIAYFFTDLKFKSVIKRMLFCEKKDLSTNSITTISQDYN